MLDDQLKVSLTSMVDASSYEANRSFSGSLVELKMTYSLNQDLDGTIALTKVNGDSDHPDGGDYPFNRMEDFSHLRFEIKYFF
jgi:hypothetical protein